MRGNVIRAFALLLAVVWSVGCGDSSTSPVDGSLIDGAPHDGGVADGSPSVDGAPTDAPDIVIDAGPTDAGPPIDAAPGTPPAVTGTSPSAGAASVEPTAVIEATFSTEMAAATIDAETFVVRWNGQPVPGVVTYAAATRTASFRPQTRMALRGAYLVTLTTGITSSAGLPLPADHAWSFAIREGSWSAAALLEDDDPSSVGCPDVVADAAGVTTAAWYHGIQPGSVLSRRFVPGEGWGRTMAVENVAADTGCPQLGVDAAGRVTAVWTQDTATGSTLYASRFDGSWAPPTRVGAEGTDEDVEEPMLAVSASGDVMVVWTVVAPMRHETWARRYTPASGWEPAVRLGADTAEAFGWGWWDVAVGADPAGNFIATYRTAEHGAEIDESLWAVRYAAGAGWGTPHLLARPSSDGSKLVVTERGDAFAMWTAHEGGFLRLTVQVALYTVGTGWGAPMRLDTNADESAIATGFASRGAVTFAHWTERAGDDGPRRVWGRRHLAGGGWEPPVQISSGDGHVWGEADIDLDPAGHAIAVWAEDIAHVQSIWARRLVSDAPWPAAVLLETGSLNASRPKVAVDPSGAGVVVWTQNYRSPEGDIYGNGWTASFR